MLRKSSFKIQNSKTFVVGYENNSNSKQQAASTVIKKNYILCNEIRQRYETSLEKLYTCSRTDEKTLKKQID